MAAAQGTCRFCGQQILVEDGEGMTELQQNGALTSYSEKERANTDSQTK